jgi:hypothetical protein
MLSYIYSALAEDAFFDEHRNAMKPDIAEHTSICIMLTTLL